MYSQGVVWQINACLFVVRTGKDTRQLCCWVSLVATEDMHMDGSVETEPETGTNAQDTQEVGGMMEQDEIQWKMLSIAYISNPVNIYFMVEGKPKF